MNTNQESYKNKQTANGSILMNLPCKHSVANMPLEEKGYHCQSCDKHLIDFRGKEQQEINQIIQNTPNRVCGVFHSHQLHYKVSTVAFSKAQSRVGLSLLGILGFLGPVISSCTTTEEHATELKQNAFNKLQFPMHLKGIMQDEKTGKPLANASVQILQKDQVILSGKTDEKGQFDLVIHENDLKQETFELAFGSKGYVADTLQKQQLLSYRSGKKIQLTIQAEPEKCIKTTHKTFNGKEIPMPGEVIVEGEVVEPIPTSLGVPAIEKPEKP